MSILIPRTSENGKKDFADKIKLRGDYPRLSRCTQYANVLKSEVRAGQGLALRKKEGAMSQGKWGHPLTAGKGKGKRSLP